MFSKRCATHVDTFTWIRNKCHKLGNVPTHEDIFTWINSRYKAFTMAEVIVTIGIIGVVAAMTLPSIIDNSRNKQLESALKKVIQHYLKPLICITQKKGLN